MSKARILVHQVAVTSYRTYDTITGCGTFCEYVVSYLRRMSYDRCSIVHKTCFREKLTLPTTPASITAGKFWGFGGKNGGIYFRISEPTD